jgi:hypothetical protein
MPCKSARIVAVNEILGIGGAAQKVRGSGVRNSIDVLRCVALTQDISVTQGLRIGAGRFKIGNGKGEAGEDRCR